VLEKLLMTLLPAAFLTLLICTDGAFRRKKVDMGGKPPIEHTLFITSKYSIMLIWFVVVLHGWGMPLPFALASPLKTPALFFWVAGFTLLFAGRLGLGESFRIGSPKEKTRLKTGGLFCLSRNPMYVGVYSTLTASVLYTMNSLILVAAIFIIVVHHKIVLAEEKTLRKVFGKDYTRYCTRVRRYL
jgi:protein-S-isoprenylcysteine O-methyltransferase Ste14